MAAAWFVLLGPVRAVIDGQQVQINRAQRRAVLAYLLLHRKRTVSADELVDALWGAEPPATARTQVLAAVSAVRGALLPFGCDPVFSSPGGYRFDIADDELDLAVFEQSSEAARQQAERSELEMAAATLRRALPLWQGSPLSGVTGAFVEMARPGLEERRFEALERLYGYELALGRNQEVVAELTELTSAHPFREASLAHLMLALHRSGRSADALAAFRSTRHRFVEELGIEPTGELHLLHKRILDNDPTLRLRREHVSAARVRRNLPRDIPDFTGRVGDLDRLDQLADAARDTAVISAIGGLAGVGKTALAIRWAHRSVERYPDGQLYLNLRGYDERRSMRPTEGLGLLLRALDVPVERIPHTEDEAASLYRAMIAGQRILVVLDNARSADQVRPLLPASPGTFALVTSRDALNGLVARDGARRLDLDVLPADDAVCLLETIVGAARIATDPQVVDDLAASCGYLPLALRIAAANLAANPDRTIAAYHAELTEGRRLPALAVEGDPQSNLQSVFAYSYEALSGAAQRLFRLLGLIPGPDVTVDSVAALAGAPVSEAELLLTALLDAYLITERPVGTVADESGRYAMHDLLREYAARLADSPEHRRERGDALDRLVDWTSRHVHGAVNRLYPAALRLAPYCEPVQFPDSASASRWLDGELHNLVALTVSAAALGHPAMAWQIPFACRNYLFMRAGRTTLISMGQAALAAAAQEADPRGRAAAELVLAQAYNLAGHDDRALRHASQCLTRAREAGWRDIEIDAHNAISVHHLHVGDLRASAQAARAAFDTCRELGVASAQHLGKLGLTSLLLGELHEASDYLEQTLVSQTGQANHSRGITLLNLGSAYRLQGRYADADQRITEAIDLFEEVGSANLVAVAQSGLALVQLAQGHRKQAQMSADCARAALEDSTDDLARAQMWYAYGLVLADHGKAIEAARVLQDALTFARTLRNRHPATELMIALAEVERAADRRDLAAELAAEAFEAARVGQFAVLEAQALDILAMLHFELGQTAEAEKAARSAIASGERTGYSGVRNARVVLGTAGPRQH